MSDVGEVAAARLQVVLGTPAHDEVRVMRFRRTLCLLTTILALTTAVALLGAGLALSGPGVTDTRPAATEAVVRAFYDEVNRAIATGDPRGVAGAVAENLVTHGALASFAPGRDGLVRYLVTLHATQPQLEIAVTQVVAAQGLSLVHLELRGVDTGSFLGSPLRGGSRPWGGVDAVAVAEAQIIEYWSGGSSLSLLEPLGQTDIAVCPPSRRMVSLDRLTIPRGASFAALGTDDARVLFVESGIATIAASPLPTGSPPDPASLHVPLPERLAGGDVVPLPTWSRIEIQNVGQETASLLVLTTESVATTAGWSSSDPLRTDEQQSAPAAIGPTAWQAGLPRISPSGAIVAPITGDMMTTRPAVRAVVAVGRVTLASGATLGEFTTAGPHLLVVNEGIVDLATSGEPVWIVEDGGRYLRASRLGAATGAMIHAGNDAILHNPGEEPVVVTLVAILPSSTTTDTAT